ncbi:MAG: hypothetical protein ACRC0X_06320 [Brevinema sp.]
MSTIEIKEMFAPVSSSVGDGNSTDSGNNDKEEDEEQEYSF